MLRATRLLLLAATLGGCATPHFYTRHVLVLDGTGLADYRVGADERNDCVWGMQHWPGHYEVDRGPYQVAVTTPIRFEEDALTLVLELRGAGEPRADIEGSPAVEDPLAPAGSRRYRLTPQKPTGRLHVWIRRDGRQIGFEEILFHEEQCRALLWRGDSK
jgi:hypothetical protein